MRKSTPDRTIAKAARLPLLLQEIATVTDIETALAIAKAKGGQDAYFAPNPTANNWLVKVVGLDKARRIGRAIATASGVELLVPIGPAAVDARRLRIEGLILDGRSNAKAATALGLHVRTIQLHRSRMRKLGLLANRTTMHGDAPAIPASRLADGKRP